MFQKRKQYKVIEDWLENEFFSRKNTIIDYRCSVRKFLVDFLKIPNPNDYPNMRRDFGKDVMDFCMHIKDNSPKSYRSLLSPIKGFFEYYDLPFPTKKERKFRKRNMGKIKKVREEKLLTSRQIKQLLSHGSVKEKAFYLTMSSGGLRPAEARGILLNINDLDMKYQPNEEITMTKIHIRKELSKNKTPRDTFINEEATQFLKEWLKERDEWLEKSQRRIYNSGNSKVKSWEDNRIFPFSQSVQSRIFHRMLKNARFVKKTNTPQRQYYEVLPKMFRTYFKTTLENEIGVARVERLLGHEGYLTESYRGISDETLQDLAIKYYENQNILNVFSSKYTDKELKSTKKELEYSKKWREEQSEKLIEEREKHKEEIQKLKSEMQQGEQDRLRAVGEYLQIISEVQRGKIEVSEYEKELIEEWGMMVITLPDEGWEEFEEKGYEQPFETITILERLRKKRWKKR